jgi:FkbM family methyltransferase
MARRSWRDHAGAALAIAFNRGGRRREVAMSYAFSAIGLVRGTIEVDAGDIRYLVDPRDTAVGLQVFTHHGYKDAEMASLLALVEEETGRVLAQRRLVEIGANIGTTTASAVVRYGAARVIAFEPDARNVELLRGMLALNGIGDAVEVHPVALSDHSGTATLEVSEVNLGDHRIRAGAPAVGHWGEERRRTTTVATAALDDIDIDFGAVALVWMDVQGHEGHVLSGARRLLASDVPVIAEYDPYLLRRAGGLELFHDRVASCFRTVIDAGTGERLAAASIAQLADRYPTPETYTDLLLLH